MSICVTTSCSHTEVSASETTTRVVCRPLGSAIVAPDVECATHVTTTQLAVISGTYSLASQNVECQSEVVQISLVVKTDLEASDFECVTEVTQSDLTQIQKFTSANVECATNLTTANFGAGEQPHFTGQHVESATAVEPLADMTLVNLVFDLDNVECLTEIVSDEDPDLTITYKLTANNVEATTEVVAPIAFIKGLAFTTNNVESISEITEASLLCPVVIYDDLDALTYDIPGIGTGEEPHGFMLDCIGILGTSALNIGNQGLLAIDDSGGQLVIGD